MVPIQEVDFHTDKKVIYKLHIISPTGAAPFLQRCLFTTLNLIHLLHQWLLFSSSFRIPKPRLLMCFIGWKTTVKSKVILSTESTTHVTVNSYHKQTNNNQSKVQGSIFKLK